MNGGAALGFLFIVLGIVIYFLPTIIGVERRHQSAGGITVLNLLLGWTGLGWIIALVWACSAVTSPQLPPVAVSQATASAGERKCPHCAELIKVEARVCKHCRRDVAPVPARTERPCPSCREMNPLERTFCAHCGAPTRQ